jgi:uncharacterized membrane protein
MDEKNIISIWFIIGCLLSLFGIIIFTANVVDYVAPWSGTVTVMHELRAGIWWGMLLIVIGLVYVIGFNPWKKKNKAA